MQSDVYSRYHVTESRRFYQGSAKWLLSPDPGSGRLTTAQLQAATPQAPNPKGATSTGNRMRPYYLYITQPGEQEPSFIILQPFVPVSAGNKQTRLVSFMTASSDPRNYGEMKAFEMPQGESVLGPVQIDNRIKSTPEVSRNLTLLNQQGSTVIQGSLQLIPVGNSILYIRPFYVQAAGESSYPQFRFVVVAYAGQDPVLATTVNDGLAQLFGQPPAQPLPDGGAAPTTPSPARGRQRAGPAEPGRRHVPAGPGCVAPGRSGYLPAADQPGRRPHQPGPAGVRGRRRGVDHDHHCTRPPDGGHGRCRRRCRRALTHRPGRESSRNRAGDLVGDPGIVTIDVVKIPRNPCPRGLSGP